MRSQLIGFVIILQMLSVVLLLVAVVLGAEPLRGYVDGGKDILPDTPVSGKLNINTCL